MLSSHITSVKLIYDVYKAIRDSDSAGGSNFQNTLFCITFDEHGGCYDHVPPPAAVPPDPDAPAGQLGFRYDRLGLRVPTVFVSAWTEPGTVVNTPLQHTSIIRTMCEKWGLPHLTERDRAAPHVGEVLNAAEPRGREDWPLPTPREDDADGTNRHVPLNRLQKCIATTVGHLVEETSPAALAELRTVDHALRFMKQKWEELRHRL